MSEVWEGPKTEGKGEAVLKKRVHVNQHAIRKNLKTGSYDPVLTVKTYRSNTYGYEVDIQGPSKVVYPEKPLSCGARVYIETESPVSVDGENPF